MVSGPRQAGLIFSTTADLLRFSYNSLLCEKRNIQWVTVFVEERGHRRITRIVQADRLAMVFQITPLRNHGEQKRIF